MLKEYAHYQSKMDSIMSSKAKDVCFFHLYPPFSCIDFFPFFPFFPLTTKKRTKLKSLETVRSYSMLNMPSILTPVNWNQRWRSWTTIVVRFSGVTLMTCLNSSSIFWANYQAISDKLTKYTESMQKITRISSDFTSTMTTYTVSGAKIRFCL